MIRYIGKRLLQMIPVVVCVAILIFTIMYFVPGDPAEIILGVTATTQEKEAVRESLGLNQPYVVRLADFLRDTFLRFDLGTSYIDGTSVLKNIMARLPYTLIISVGSMAFAMVVGIILGTIAALNQNGIADRLCMILALIGVSMPGFWLALMLVIWLALQHNILPSYGAGSIKHFIMPWIAAALPELARLARQARSSMLEVIHSDFVTTAKAKGVKKWNVVFKHELPNAMIPIITTIGAGLAHGMGGALVIESVFSIPGLGLYITNSINNRDYPAVQGTIVFFSIVFSVIMLLVDLAYAAVDPRIKAAFSGSAQKRKKVKAAVSEEKENGGER
ncbi:MAG: ABC transporter permease [Clostridiales bacterium]|nr:ABC transporter permease [Clostridiales bacterium]